MKFLLASLFFLTAFCAFAQNKTSASAQHGVTFTLRPVALVERVSSNASPAETMPSASLQPVIGAGQKWAVQLKKLTELNERSYASLSPSARPEQQARNLQNVHVYTVSKP